MDRLTRAEPHARHAAQRTGGNRQSMNAKRHIGGGNDGRGGAWFATQAFVRGGGRPAPAAVVGGA